MKPDSITCILLAASHAPELALDIEKDSSYDYLRGVPKALLPGPHGVKIIDHWWRAIKSCERICQTFLVTNADKYKHFERWASAAGFPLDAIVNDGSTLPSNALGAVQDLELTVRMKQLMEHNVLVIAGDMMYQVGDFELSDVLKCWCSKPSGDVAVYYTLHESELTSTRGILELDQTDGRILKFLEKPLASATTSRCASVVLYGLRSAALQLLQSFAAEQTTPTALGRFMAHAINSNKREVYGHHVQTGFQLIGAVTLSQYLSWRSHFSTALAPTRPSTATGFTARAYARVGIMGNPSDGFNGKTIAMTIRNFWADVTIEESATLRLLPHPLNDPMEFGSLGDLHGISTRDGYLGGLRLLQATCKMFYHYCSNNDIPLHKTNFTLQYGTNIPRQVGLAGSSAIVTATLHALLAFYGVSDDDLPLVRRPQLVLDVETQELAICAGLQDRVVQVYEGLVYMDFSAPLLKRDGHGRYERIQLPEGVSLPTLFLVYRLDSSDSGKIHSTVKVRFDRGDADVLSGMSELASITEEAVNALTIADWTQLGALMERNFRVRERMYSRECLGEGNLRMLELGRQYGASVKFPGSGGAVLGLVTSATDMTGLRSAYQSEGCVVVDVIPHLSRQRTLLSH